MLYPSVGVILSGPGSQWMRVTNRVGGLTEVQRGDHPVREGGPLLLRVLMHKGAAGFVPDTITKKKAASRVVWLAARCEKVVNKSLSLYVPMSIIDRHVLF